MLYTLFDRKCKKRALRIASYENMKSILTSSMAITERVHEEQVREELLNALNHQNL